MVKGQTSCRCSSPDIPKHRDLHRIYARALTDRFSHTITRHFLGCPPRRVHLFPAWDEDDAAVREIALTGSPGEKSHVEKRSGGSMSYRFYRTRSTDEDTKYRRRSRPCLPVRNAGAQQAREGPVSEPVGTQ